jgi:MYXO-CTERM domain-containing protein
MHRILSASLAVAAAMSFAGVSRAHIALTSPAPRHAGDREQKTSPCGVANDARGSEVTVLASGQTITLSWHETVDHPGHYRIMFDDDGFDDFPDPASGTDFCEPGRDRGCLADNIADASGGAGTYTQDVTLPDIECENCTIQLIQVMTDRSPASMYYRCADVALRASGGTAVSSGTGSAASSGAGAGGGGGAGSSGAQDDDGGCSFGGSGGAPAPAGLLPLALAALAARGRRKKR